ncbi:MAG: S8 family serine peptidase, partial [Chloroflexi bacterium]|nr:S8 family serine peptidase [Chloroflexota bacterium]
MSTSKLRFFLPLLGIILLLGLWGLRGGEAAPPPPTTQPKAAGAPTKGGHPKMESILSQVAEAHGIQGAAAAQELAQRNGVTLSNSLVRVVIESQTGQAQGARNAVASLGGQVEGSYRDLVQAQAPLSALTSLADNPQVRFVRRPLKPMPLVVSQGVTLTNAKAWQNAGVTGSGVKAAVLDLGFYGYQALLGTELPSSVITNVFGFGGDITGGGESHGTAVAEIVHDMAPGATKYLVAAETEVDTANAVSWMCSQGVKVINYSVGWVNTGPGDGTGTLNNIVRDALNCGILWVNAAGNEGQRHWRGTFTDSNLNTWNEFSGADEGNTISHGGGWVVAALSWNDPFGASSNDFDLFLTNSGDATVCSSEGFQTGTQNPTEFIGCYVAAAGTYHIKIKKYLAISNPTPTMNLFTFYHNLEYQTAAYSLMQPADSRNGMAAGAVYWGTPTVIESFSSQGPTEDGRTKPDISAPDGTAGVTYGLSSFYGTSAASPHTAGAAALVMQSYPMSTVTQTRAFLEGRAIDLGAAGKDNVFGAGRLNLGTPISGTSSPILSVAPSSIGVTLAPGSIVTRPMTVSNIGGGTLVYTITEAAGGASAALTNEALAAQGQRIDAPTGANTSAPGIVIPKEAFAPVREAFLAGTATPAAVSTYFPATGDTYATYSGYPWWWVTGDYAQGNRTLTLTSISHI